MASANLNLHSGGHLVTLEELRRFRAPPPEGRWHPVAHIQVHDRTRETLEAAGYEVASEQLAVHRDNHRFFGVMELKTTVSEGVALAVGIRNSTDRSYPLGFAAGNRVFVCSNLAFSAELMVRHKHTLHGERRFSQAIAHAVSHLASFKEEEQNRIRRLQGTGIDNTLAESLILRAWDKGIVSSPQVPVVLKQWRQPEYREFEQRTAWSLFNAITFVLTDRATRNPPAFVAQTMQLHHLLDFHRGEADVAQAASAG
jgi:hypothetical protein